MEIRDSIPHVIAEAEKLGYKVDKMAISGGSAGGTLALLYAYRDAEQSPVPVKMVFEAVGLPASTMKIGKTTAWIKIPKLQQICSV